MRVVKADDGCCNTQIEALGAVEPAAAEEGNNLGHAHSFGAVGDAISRACEARVEMVVSRSVREGCGEGQWTSVVLELECWRRCEERKRNAGFGGPAQPLALEIT